jgi:hypothetical protein
MQAELRHYIAEYLSRAAAKSRPDAGDASASSSKE